MPVCPPTSQRCCQAHNHSNERPLRCYNTPNQKLLSPHSLIISQQPVEYMPPGGGGGGLMQSSDLLSTTIRTTQSVSTRCQYGVERKHLSRWSNKVCELLGFAGCV